MHTIQGITAIPIDLPLRETFVTAQRQANSSPSVLIKLTTSGDVTGWGEATLVKYVTGEDQDSVIQAVAKAREVILGRPVESYRVCSTRLAAAIPSSPSARAGIEVAIIDAASRAARLPLYLYFGGRPMTIETDITIPLVETKQAASLARQAAKLGFSKFKVKVGSPDIDQDIERVVAISEIEDKASFILDANEGFSAEAAISFINELLSRNIDIAIFEQPVSRRDTAGLKRVKESLPVPVFADEAVHTPKDALELVRREAVSGFVVKLMKTGPIDALSIASIAKAAGLGLMMGTMLESRLGQSASLHIAAATGMFKHYDLDSDMLLGNVAITGGFRRSGSIVSLTDQPGLGVEVSV